MKSNYKLLGYGVIIKDTLPDDKVAEIAIYETVSLDKTFDKEEKEKKNEKQSDLVKSGSDILSFNSVEAEMTVEAMWLNSGSTRVNMPLMKQGELVKVYNYTGADRYYFKLTHLEKDLRRKEMVVHAVSNLDSEKKEDFGKTFDEKSSYHYSVDTVNKKVRLKTATNDSEPVLWEILLDTKAGVFSILVDGKEKVVLDGVNDKLTINVATTLLNGTTLEMKLSDWVTLTASTFNNKAKQTIHSGIALFKKAVEFKSKCKMNALTSTTDGAKVL